jgi:hypothetical protein
MSPLKRKMMMLEAQLEYASQNEKLAHTMHQKWPEEPMAQTNLDYARAFKRQVQRQIAQELPV